MKHAKFPLGARQASVVGSFGNARELYDTDLSTLREACDIVEIRLDLLGAEAEKTGPKAWSGVSGMPLLFTARRIEEGGALPLSPADRMDLLRHSLDDAAYIDIEVASIDEMQPILEEISNRGIPWIASYHDFEKLPETAVLEAALEKAKQAGAAVFKSAARLATPADLARLAEFQLAEHGIPVSTMGMGALAPVSRLLCAQSGSVLNYGYIGKTATAPGQWDSKLLKTAISTLTPISR